MSVGGVSAIVVGGSEIRWSIVPAVRRFGLQMKWLVGLVEWLAVTDVMLRLSMVLRQELRSGDRFWVPSGSHEAQIWPSSNIS